MPMRLSPEEQLELELAIPALRLALVSGTTRITYDGRTIEYRSVAEMREALRYAEETLNPTPAGMIRPSFAVTKFSRGM